MFRLKSNPRIVVRLLGPAEHRKGATIKEQCVAYMDSSNVITTRATPEFYRLFEPIPQTK